MCPQREWISTTRMRSLHSTTRMRSLRFAMECTSNLGLHLGLPAGVPNHIVAFRDAYGPKI